MAGNDCGCEDCMHSGDNHGCINRLSMHNEKPRRWLGRGVAPSQPVPFYLRTGSIRANKGWSERPWNVVAAVGVVLVVLVAWGLIIRRDSSREATSLKPVLGAVAHEVGLINPLDFLLAGSTDRKLTTELLTVERVWIDACQRSDTVRTPADQCDRQPFFERALVKAVVMGAECMPERPKEESISFALEVNYKAKTMRLFAGRSGTVTGAQAKPVIACVKPFLAEPDWGSVPHDHTRYVIGVLVRYSSEKRQ